MSQVPNADREHDIEERAEEIEPGSADKLMESRQAIDEAFGAAAAVESADLTDVEFDPSDSGAAGATDEQIDDVSEQDAADGEQAATDEEAATRDERDAEADETAAARDEAFVVEDEGLSNAAAEEAGREGSTGGDAGGRP